MRAEIWQQDGKFYCDDVWERDGEKITGKSDAVFDNLKVIAEGTCALDWEAGCPATLSQESQSCLLKSARHLGDPGQD